MKQQRKSTLNSLFPLNNFIKETNFIKKGYRVAIITGGNSQAVKQALMSLGIDDIFLAQSDKLQCYKDYIYENQLNEEEIVYMGDDLPDYEVMKREGIAACPNNAAHEIKQISIYFQPKWR